jgi:hypothetical protein
LLLQFRPFYRPMYLEVARARGIWSLVSIERRTFLVIPHIFCLPPH